MLKRNVIITGSTSGIGLGIAKKFASLGHNIMLNGFGNSQDIDKIKNDLMKLHNIRVLYSSADMTKIEQIKQMVDDAYKELGSVDILVNNAGIQFTASVEEFPDDKWKSIIDINLSAAFYASKAVLPLMKQNNFGRIINIASAHGLVGSVHKSSYVAAKHGVIGLTKVVALENATQNITCNAICPGFVNTPLVQKQIEVIAENEKISLDEARKNFLYEKHPSLRFVEVSEIAEAAIFLSSELMHSLTGTFISIDGGWSAR